MKNITQPYPTAFQVRIVNNKKETSRLFSFSHWGGKNKALAAARSWRDQVNAIMKKRVRRLTKVPSHNKSTGVLGVSRTHRYDKRKDLKHLVYSVNWIDHSGKKRGKTFWVCNVRNYDREMDLIAFEAAKQFRKEWEHHVDNDSLHLFNPSKYINWREGNKCI